MRTRPPIVALLVAAACGGSAQPPVSSTPPVPAPATNLEEDRQKPPTPVEVKPAEVDPKAQPAQPAPR